MLLNILPGIFFKLAIDNMVLYGGDDHAMKVAGHDLRGLNAFVAHSLMFHIYFPLTVSRGERQETRDEKRETRNERRETRDERA